MTNERENNSAPDGEVCWIGGAYSDDPDQFGHRQKEFTGDCLNEPLTGELLKRIPMCVWVRPSLPGSELVAFLRACADWVETRAAGSGPADQTIH